MIRAALPLLCAVLLGAAAACDGCAACAEGEVIATVTAIEGTVERDWAERREAWETAERGEELSFEDAVRTGADSRTALELVGGAELRVDPETVVRLLRGVPERREPGLAVETGSAVLESGDERRTVHTSFGSAVLEPGTRVRLDAAEGGIRYEVLVGRATLEHGDATTELSAGDELSLDDDGEARIPEAVPEPDAGRALPDAGSPEAGSRPDVVELDVRGRGVQAREPAGRRFRDLAQGPGTVAAGTELRLRRRATVEVRRGDAVGTLTGPGRFVVADGETLVRAAAGALAVESGAIGDVTVEVPGGTIVVRAGGSRGEAAVNARRGTQVRAVRGTLAVRSEGGEEQELEAGESASLRPGGDLDPNLRPPARPMFTVQAGSSFTVRDAQPPTAVGFRFGSLCPGAGVVQLAGGAHASHGRGAANLWLAAGPHRYSVRCIDASGEPGEAVGSGTVRVLRDRGRTMFPRVPPASVVDTDGRRYTVLYQTLLPEITVRWPRAEGGAPYRLRVTSGGRSRTLTASEPRYRFDSGELTEGVHELSFESGSGRSRPTTLAIGFDNAAPTAMVTSPSDGSFAPGSSVRVAGVALDGWAVAVEGTEIPLDPQRRFDAQVTAPPDQDGIAIRLSHPARGVHYYVRHGSSAP